MSDATDNTFSAGETKLLISIMKNLSGDLQSDWDAVAVDMGYKDGTIARTRWNQTRRKKITGPASSTAKTPKTTTKKPAAATKKGTAAKAKSRARKPADSDDDDENEDDKDKEIAVKVKAEKEDNDDDDEDSEEEEKVKKVIPAKKTGGKQVTTAAKSGAAKPKGVNKRKVPALAAARDSDSDSEDEYEKRVKRFKRVVKADEEVAAEVGTDVGTEVATEAGTEDKSGSGEDAVMGATQEDEDEEIVKKEATEEEEEEEESEV